MLDKVLRVKQMFTEWKDIGRDELVIKELDRENIENVFRFAMIILVLEIVNLVAFLGIYGKDWGLLSVKRSAGQVVFCIIACIIATVITGRWKKAREGKDIPHWEEEVLIGGFYLAMSVWGMLVDGRHFAKGDQMLTFYIVQFCFACFIVLRPYMTIVLMSGVFIAFYVMIRVVGTGGMRLLNYLFLVALMINGSLIRYRLAVDRQKNTIKIQELNRALTRSAMLDELTGLKNRRALREDFSAYQGRTLWVTMADIDLFKKFNDTYGHDVGDQVLKNVSVALKEAFAQGFIYRYGGDEFLILFQGDEREYEKCISLWKEKVARIQIREITEPICCSSGYTIGAPESAEELRELIRKADGRLYETKAQHKKVR